MKRFINGAILLSAVMALSSCSEESWVGEPGKGGIRLSLQASGDVKEEVPGLRSGTMTIETPESSQFGIKLEKSDGSYSKSWNDMASFRAEKGFKAGAYTISAFYGEINEEGFEKPCFQGSSTVNVIEDKETEVGITASLANSMVSISYTQEFKAFFKDWSASMHSEGHDWIEYTSTEERPAFLAPGTVQVSVTMTNQSGKSVTLQPAEFTAAAQHHYHITFDVNNGMNGETQLGIVFDDEVVAENVFIDLTEELFTTPAPEVKPVGFADGDTVEALEGSASVGCKYTVIGRGGLQGVTLTVNSDTYTPSFGAETNLMGLTVAQQNEMTAAGVKCAGLWKNPGAMATVDMSDFCSQLPAGEHKITLQAKDRFTRVSEPVTMTVRVSAVDVRPSATDVVFGSSEAIVNVAYNGENVANVFSFKALNNYGTYVDCEVLNIEEVATRSFEMKNYRFSISIPDCERSELPIAVYYKGNLVETLKARVVTPSYDVSVDALANSAEINVTPEELSHLAGIVNNLSLYVGGQKVPEGNITRLVEKGRIILKGLRGATAYNLQTSLVLGSMATDTNFTTESETAVPNGDFETLTLKYDNVTLNQGGIWSDLGHWTTQQNKETFNVSEPTGWATVNSKTFNYSESVPTNNTWFSYPSTINITDAKSGSNAMLIRSVGYAYSGSVPGRDTNTGTQPYSDKVATVANRAAGKLFLGAYSINTSTMEENYNQGVEFTTRPSALNGYYKYEGVNGDEGTVSVELYNGTTLVASGSGRFAAQSSYAAFSVPLAYEIHGMRPTHLRIMFASSKNSSFNHADETANVVCNSYATASNQSWIGSQLRIDNLSFSYGTPSYKANAKKMVIRKKAKKK